MIIYVFNQWSYVLLALFRYLLLGHTSIYSFFLFFFFLYVCLFVLGASLVTQTVKHLSIMRETLVRSLGQENPLEKEMAILSSTFAWKTSWTEEPGRLQSMGLQRVRHDWATSLSLCLFLVFTLHIYQKTEKQSNLFEFGNLHWIYH